MSSTDYGPLKCQMPKRSNAAVLLTRAQGLDEHKAWGIKWRADKEWGSAQCGVRRAVCGV